MGPLLLGDPEQTILNLHIIATGLLTTDQHSEPADGQSMWYPHRVGVVSRLLRVTDFMMSQSSSPRVEPSKSRQRGQLSGSRLIGTPALQAPRHLGPPQC